MAAKNNSVKFEKRIERINYFMGVAKDLLGDYIFIPGNSYKTNVESIFYGGNKPYVCVESSDLSFRANIELNIAENRFFIEYKRPFDYEKEDFESANDLTKVLEDAVPKSIGTLCNCTVSSVGRLYREFKFVAQSSNPEELEKIKNVITQIDDIIDKHT